MPAEDPPNLFDVVTGIVRRKMAPTHWGSATLIQTELFPSKMSYRLDRMDDGCATTSDTVSEIELDKQNMIEFHGPNLRSISNNWPPLPIPAKIYETQVLD